jgi:DNA-binding transcriptional regulator YiaG
MRRDMEGEDAGQWDGARVRELRKRLGMSQDALADQLGMRQQTISEWETGRHRPRGASVRLLGMIAEGAGPQYIPQSREHLGTGDAGDREASA